MKPKVPHTQRGFTFLEVIIVLGIVGIIMPIIFSILLNVSRQQVKIYRLSEVKQQGDYAMSFMKSYIRNNSEAIYNEDTLTNEMCATSVPPNNVHISVTGSNFYFKQEGTSNDYFRFFVSTDSAQIMFDDNGAQQQLTTSKIKIINNEMEMVCIKKTASGTPYVIISFSAYYTTNLSIARPEDVAILHYKGIVHLR